MDEHKPTNQGRNNCSIRLLTYLPLGIASLLILFSLFAPIIFTSNSSLWDFTGTGSIGDTIGGIMGPFIGIAGVIATFTAFIIQVQANKIQREQFMKSLNKGIVDEKLDSHYKLQLMKIDIDGTIKDIEKRIAYLNDYITQIQSDPFRLAKLFKTTMKRYDRIASIERMAIYKGFKYFVSDDNKDWLASFNKLYSILDYLSEAFNELYGIEKYHNEDIWKDKESIRVSLISLDECCVNYLYQSAQGKRTNETINAVLNLVKEYRSIVTSSKHEEADFKRIKKILHEFMQKIEYNMPINDDSLKRICEKVSLALITLNSIEQKSTQLIPELQRIANCIAQNEKSVKNELKTIRLTIQSALDRHPIEKIQREYLQ